MYDYHDAYLEIPKNKNKKYLVWYHPRVQLSESSWQFGYWRDCFWEVPESTLSPLDYTVEYFLDLPDEPKLIKR